MRCFSTGFALLSIATCEALLSHVRQSIIGPRTLGTGLIPSTLTKGCGGGWGNALGAAAPQQTIEIEASPPRVAYGVLWIGLLLYAFLFAPGGGTSELDEELIKTMISSPFSPDNMNSPIFGAIFNALGIMPAVYASLLLPGTKKQKVPGLAFVVSSFALGYFGIGPYLALRNIQSKVTKSERGRGSALFESKITSLAMLGFALFLAYFAVAGNYGGSDRIADFFRLFESQKLVHVSTIDLTILSLAVQEPMREDMGRRNWTGNDAWMFAALPVIGPCLYLLIRPELPEE